MEWLTVSLVRGGSFGFACWSFSFFLDRVVGLLSEGIGVLELALCLRVRIIDGRGTQAVIIAGVH